MKMKQWKNFYQNNQTKNIWVNHLSFLAKKLILNTDYKKGKMDDLFSVVFFTVPVFLIVSSIILSIKYLRIKNTILSVLLLINAFLPMGLVATFVSGAQKNILTLILSANICLCAFDLIVIFILPFLSDQKTDKGYWEYKNI